ncbi:MAG: alpha/beta fold hydrolase [Candidatus Methylomirabilia bacterium]
MKSIPGFAYRAKFHAVDGVRLAYVEQGKGEPVILLHGNPTWGFLYRKFIPPLARTNRVIVPDHMGFGRSDKPLDASLYRLARHITNLESLLLKLNAKHATLVMQDWGGPIGLGFAIRHPERIKRLVILNTWAWVVPAGTRIHALLEQFRIPGLGEALVQGLNLFVEGFLPAGISKKERVTPALMRAYRAPFPDWNSRVGILAFPRDITVGDDHPSAPTMREISEKLPGLKVPTLLIWAVKDPAFPRAMIGLWQKIYPEAEVHTLEQAGHYLQEDEPEAIVALIQDFLRRNP